MKANTVKAYNKRRSGVYCAFMQKVSAFDMQHDGSTKKKK